MLVFLLSLLPCHQTSDFTTLTQSTSLLHQTLRHSESKVYLLTDLIPGQLYEFKVSYPAIMPYTFTIQFSEDVNKIPKRKLLDIEKEEFTPTSTSLYVTITAHDYNKSLRPAQYVRFGVYYEPVHYGVPEQAYKLIAWLCVCLPVSVVVAVLVFNRYLVDEHEHKT